MELGEAPGGVGSRYMAALGLPIIAALLSQMQRRMLWSLPQGKVAE